MHLTFEGVPCAMGHSRAESVYWNPGWCSMETGRIVEGTVLGGGVSGLVLKVLDASTLAEIPDTYKEDAPWIIYQVLIGEDVPLWFPWREIQLLNDEEEGLSC